MSIKSNNKIQKSLYWLALFSFCVALAEGFMYYEPQTYPNVLFRHLLILQNAIKAFSFRPDIGLKDVAKVVYDNTDTVKTVIGYLYGISVFTAPYCTIAAVYKFLKRIFRLKSWFAFGAANRERIVIFGYNPEVKALLAERSQDSQKKYRIHIVSKDVPEKEEDALLKKGIMLHSFDCLKLGGRQVDSFWDQAELSDAKKIVLYEDSSGKNFSIYRFLCEKSNPGSSRRLNANVKFFCRCEEGSIKSIVEDYYDQDHTDGKADLELVDIPELRVRKLLREHPLHQYYLDNGVTDPDKWDLHLLIIGFGKVGQQLLLQAMSQGVTSSRNKILIDVVDNKIEEKRSIFANHFNEEYVVLNDNEYVIPDTAADGEFRVRFHKMDIRYKAFYQQLIDNGNPQKDGIYTYIAICVEDMDISLHCMSEVERYLKFCPAEDCGKSVSLAIRLETDRAMADYLNQNKRTYKNVFAIEESCITISLQDLIDDNLDSSAKAFNHIYSKIELDGDAPNELDEKEAWRQLALVRRDSNRALALHDGVKETLLNTFWGDDHSRLSRYFGPEGSIIKLENKTWCVDGSDDVFIQKLAAANDGGVLTELAKLEHRRWCYYMASRGWKCTTDPTMKKNDAAKENPCLCTWHALVKNRTYMCKYDLMPLLYRIQRSE